MFKRIYVDNYKCLVNVALPVQEINLFLGANGSGKSTVFESLKSVRDFVCGGKRILSVFPSEYLTRWQSSPIQIFELEVEGNGGSYKYELAVEHSADRNKAKVDYERLFFDGRPLIKLESGNIQLYRDNFSEGPNYYADWTLSAVGAIPSRHDNTRLTWFREYLRRFIIVQTIPPMMYEESPQEDSSPSFYLENYISWYRHISQDQGLAFQLTTDLRNVLPGYDYFKFEPVGEKHRSLQVYFQSAGADSIDYKFSELSDGQRMLIALYSLLHTARAEQEYRYTLCIDQSGNFVALSEIQPWLTELYDSCTGRQMQSLLISHHPEFINYLLASPRGGYWFERQSNRPTRVRPITASEEDGLAISELVARGWLSE